MFFLMDTCRGLFFLPLKSGVINILSSIGFRSQFAENLASQLVWSNSKFLEITTIQLELIAHSLATSVLKIAFLVK